jgi:hypothetical protein
MRKQNQDGKGAIETIEDAFQLVRSAPFSTITAYYIGTLPFILALLYFWADMSSGVLAEQRLAGGASFLCLLFIWMKVWQAVYARKLLAQLTGESEPRWDRQRIIRTVVAQTVLQPSGLFLIPVSALILMPFAWVFTFYQNAVIFGAGDESDLKTVFSRCWRQMKLWPSQNHCILMALEVFGLFVLFNVILGALGVPFLMKGLLGIETAFTQSWLAALNTTFFMTVLTLTYLCYDPLVKATYVARCFYGQSLETAEDLRAELRASISTRKLATVTICFLLLSACAWGASAAEPESVSPVSPAALDRSISEVIQQREYTWRMPREKAPSTKTDLGWIERRLKAFGAWFQRVVQRAFNWLRKVIQWLLQKRRQGGGGGGSGFNWYAAFKFLLILLLAALLFSIVLLILRMLRQKAETSEVLAQPLPSAPDLLDEHTGADQLPEDGWLQMARELLEAGDLRLALRAYYLASLAHLAERNLITIARYKSNREYERELSRRAHAVPTLMDTFSDNVSTFDRVWYGLHEVTRDLLEGFASNVARIRTATLG